LLPKAQRPRRLLNTRTRNDRRRTQPEVRRSSPNRTAHEAGGINGEESLQRSVSSKRIRCLSRHHPGSNQTRRSRRTLPKQPANHLSRRAGEMVLGTPFGGSTIMSHQIKTMAPGQCPIKTSPRVVVDNAVPLPELVEYFRAEL